MTNNDEDRKCQECGGSGITKPVIQDFEEAEKNGAIKYQPLKCKHCNGTGNEPK